MAEPANQPETLQSGVECLCGRWQHRSLRAGTFAQLAGAAIGHIYLTEESRCPKCAGPGAGNSFSRGRYLLLFRIQFNPLLVTSIGLAPLPAVHESAMRAALLRIAPRLPADELDALVAGARAYAAAEESAA